jgi:6-phosphofructokinase 1
MSTKGNFGILVGGGPAPGLNGVISAVTIEACRLGYKVWGILDGYKWLAKGDESALMKNVLELQIEDVTRIHYNGGSILHTSRTNPKNIENGFENSVRMLNKLGVVYMVTIGGDDTAYSASQIAKAAKGKIKFAHVPKTIDNDLPLPNNLPTFGYETARELGAILVKNLMEDSKTTHRWYIAVAMGRHAGHLAVGMAKSAGATLAIIPEEFDKDKPISLNHVCDIMETSMLKRLAMGQDYGLLVIAEGIAERLSPDELKKIPALRLEYDDFGNLRLDEIELGKVIKQEIEYRFKNRNDKVRVIEINVGYVLRCADPNSFDQEYTRDLGFNAVHYLISEKTEEQKNAMITVDNATCRPIPFEEMLDPETGKTAVRLVDTNSDTYKVARGYMIRLEKEDLESPSLVKKMVQAAKMSEKDFVERYGYLVE